ncbi:MAG: DNA polymerase III subunit delta [Nitrospiraceae bacterium]|nr:DNA polymerase III subunit delta [Nitrospiraceae bacterium]
MSIKQFQKELGDSFPSPCYLLHSADDFLLYEAAAQVKALFSDENGFNLDSFDLKDTDASIEAIIDIANTLPFFNPRRVVLIRGLQKLKKAEAKKLEAYLAAPSPSCLMILLFEGQAPKLFDAAVMKAIKVIPLAVSGRDLPAWVKAEAQQKGISFSDEAVEYLIESAGTDLGMLHAEIEKAASALEHGSSVDKDTLKDILYAGAEYSAFDLTDALAKKDNRAVFRIYERLNRQQGAEMLLGALNYHYARQMSGFSGQQKRSGMNAPHNLFSLLHDADLGLKSSRSFVMDDLLYKLLKQG